MKLNLFTEMYAKKQPRTGRMTSQNVIIRLTIEIDENTYTIAVRERREEMLKTNTVTKIMGWLTKSLTQTLQEHENG